MGKLAHDQRVSIELAHNCQVSILMGKLAHDQRVSIKLAHNCQVSTRRWRHNQKCLDVLEVVINRDGLWKVCKGRRSRRPADAHVCRWRGAGENRQMGWLARTDGRPTDRDEEMSGIWIRTGVILGAIQAINRLKSCSTRIVANTVSRGPVYGNSRVDRVRVTTQYQQQVWLSRIHADKVNEAKRNPDF